MSKILMDWEKLEIAVARADHAEARVRELGAILGGLCAYPLCECGSGKECRVLDTPVPEVCARSDLIEAIDNRDSLLLTLEAECDRLAARVVEMGRALKECSTMMAHARIFTISRERIKQPEGIDLYDGAIDRANRAFASDGSAVADVIAAARLVAEGKAIDVGTTPLRMNNLRQKLDRLDGKEGG